MDPAVKDAVMDGAAEDGTPASYCEAIVWRTDLWKYKYVWKLEGERYTQFLQHLVLAHSYHNS